MSGGSLEQLLQEAGRDRPRVEQVLCEVAQGLLEARLVVDRERWQRASENDAFAMEFLTGVLGAATRSWDEERLLGAPALQTFREVNRRAHAWATTTGAARHRSAVVAAQGGEFCSICGRREQLVVDHVVPVSVGGSQDALSNMQLLCQECNLGKSNLRDRLLPVAIGMRESRELSASLRLKHLLLDSVVVDGRTRGVCSCSRRADEGPLRVSITPRAAANLLTLRTRCSGCEEN